MKSNIKKTNLIINKVYRKWKILPAIKNHTRVFSM